MYICLCNAVTDHDIAEAVQTGAEDMDSVADRLGAGTGCGTCREAAQSVIDEALARQLGHAA